MEGADRETGSFGGQDGAMELYSPVSVAAVGADGELLRPRSDTLPSGE